MPILGINEATGNWVASDFEIPNSDKKNWGMMYRSTSSISARAKDLADELDKILKGTGEELEVDNPLVLAKITALSGNYNMARQLQSNLMKSIKDTAQTAIRNV